LSGIYPFWSPDGKYIGFFSNGKLRKIEAAGGPVQALCDAPEGRGGAWNKQGAILFAPRIAGPLQRVSDGGGTPEDATPANKEDKEFTNRNPYFLPDGKHFLFVQRYGKDSRGSVYSGSLDGGQPKQLLPFGSNVAYSEGYLFYLKDDTLMGQAFDAAGLRFNGNPIPIAESIEYYNPRNIGYFSVSQNVLVYRQKPGSVFKTPPRSRHSLTSGCRVFKMKRPEVQAPSNDRSKNWLWARPSPVRNPRILACPRLVTKMLAGLCRGLIEPG
jgi:hypothetical protein